MLKAASAFPDPPFEVEGEGEDTGLDVELMRAVCQRLNLTYHLVKRVVSERQWAYGTPAEAYLADLREAAQVLDGRLALYFRRGGHMAAVLVRNRLDPAKLGSEPLPRLLVVFSADRGTMVSGYQISSVALSNIPGDALWLK